MNARLVAKLLRPQPDQAAPRLLGAGIDDIIQHSPRTLSENERLLRYVRAKFLCPPGTAREHKMAELREALGTAYRNAWRKGMFPKFSQIRHRFSAERLLGAHEREVARHADNVIRYPGMR